MAKKWIAPQAVIEQFVANDYVAACYEVECRHHDGVISYDMDGNGTYETKPFGNTEVYDCYDNKSETGYTGTHMFVVRVPGATAETITLTPNAVLAQFGGFLTYDLFFAKDALGRVLDNRGPQWNNSEYATWHAAMYNLNGSKYSERPNMS